MRRHMKRRVIGSVMALLMAVSSLGMNVNAANTANTSAVIEYTDTEASDTEASNTEASNTEASDAEASDAEASNTEIVDADKKTEEAATAETEANETKATDEATDEATETKATDETAATTSEEVSPATTEISEEETDIAENEIYATIDEFQTGHVYIYTVDSSVKNKVDYFLKDNQSYADKVHVIDITELNVEMDTYSFYERAYNLRGTCTRLFVLDQSDISDVSNMLRPLGYYGITSDSLSGVYDFTKEVGVINDTLYAVASDVEPGDFIYNKKVAKEVLGTNDANTISNMLNTVDGFMEVAKKMKQKGYYMTAGSYLDYGKNFYNKYNEFAFLSMINQLKEDGCIKDDAEYSEAWFNDFETSTSKVFGFFSDHEKDLYTIPCNTELVMDVGVSASPVPYTGEDLYWAVSSNCTDSKSRQITVTLLNEMCLNSKTMSGRATATTNQDFVNNKNATNFNSTYGVSAGYSYYLTAISVGKTISYNVLKDYDSAEDGYVYIYTFADDLKARMEYVYETYPEYRNKVKIINVYDMSDYYMDRALALAKKASALGGNCTRIVCMDTYNRDELLPYTQPLSDLSEAPIGTYQYEYTKKAGNYNGTVHAVSYEANPGIFIYDMNIAKKVLGTTNQDEINKKLNTFEGFLTVANEMKAAGYYMTSEFDIDLEFFNTQNGYYFERLFDTMDSRGYLCAGETWSEEWNEAVGSGKVFGQFAAPWYTRYSLPTDSPMYGNCGVAESPIPYSWGGNYLAAMYCGNNTTTDDIADKIIRLLCDDSQTMTKLAERSGDSVNNIKVMASAKNSDPAYKNAAGVNKIIDSAAKKVGNIISFNESVGVYYRTHVQSYGWQPFVSNGAMSGTSGQAKRLEGINIVVTAEKELGIQYTTHCQTYGWLPWSANGEMNGTEGEAKRLEAIKIQLTGYEKDNYDVYYRVHAQTYGWLGWAKNGQAAGTAGLAKRLEGIQIVVVKKNASFNQNMGSIVSKTTSPFISSTNQTDVSVPGAEKPIVTYRTHIQSIGWQAWKTNGALSGTIGQAKRLEGIEIDIKNKIYDGDIEYMTYVQSYGAMADPDLPWTWTKNGEMSGTSGEAKRLEAIRIKVTGDIADNYEVYYRVHAESYGWLGWATDGEIAGTIGLGKRLEGIQIVLVKIGDPAPSSTYGGYTSKTTKTYISK